MGWPLEVVVLVVLALLWARMESRLSALARAVDQVDERVLEQFGTLGGALGDVQVMVGDVHQRAKHPHPLHGPVK